VTPRQPPAERPPTAPDGGPAGGRSRLNSGGLIYGTLVAAAAVAIGSTHGNTPGDLEDAMLSTVLIYWLAHVYTATLSGRRPGEGPPLWRRAWAGARHEAPILLGGVPLAVLVLALWLAGVNVNGIAIAALGTAIGLLAVEGGLAARQAGVTGWRLAAEAAGAAVFGALIGLLMAALHS
jgi:hypothetical protein